MELTQRGEAASPEFLLEDEEQGLGEAGCVLSQAGAVTGCQEPPPRLPKLMPIGGRSGDGMQEEGTRAFQAPLFLS